MMKLLPILLSVVLLAALPARADAVTVRDIIELTKAGVPDAVLTALIDADRTLFTLDAAQILELRNAGVSEAVLLKMLASRREFGAKPEGAAPPPPEPGVVIIGAAPPPVVTLIVPQYVVVPLPIWGRRPHPRDPAAPVLAPEHRGFGRFINH